MWNWSWHLLNTILFVMCLIMFGVHTQITDDISKRVDEMEIKTEMFINSNINRKDTIVFELNPNYQIINNKQTKINNNKKQ